MAPVDSAALPSLLAKKAQRRGKATGQDHDQERAGHDAQLEVKVVVSRPSGDTFELDMMLGNSFAQVKEACFVEYDLSVLSMDLVCGHNQVLDTDTLASQRDVGVIAGCAGSNLAVTLVTKQNDVLARLDPAQPAMAILTGFAMLQRGGRSSTGQAERVAIISVANSASELVQSKALGACGRFAKKGDEDVIVLCLQLASSSSTTAFIRSSALTLVGKIALRGDERVMVAALETAEDANASVRKSSLCVLDVVLLGLDDRVFQVATACLKDPKEAVQQMALQLMSSLALADPRAMEYLQAQELAKTLPDGSALQVVTSDASAAIEA